MSNQFVEQTVSEAWYALVCDAPISHRPSIAKYIARGERWWKNYFSTVPFSTVNNVMNQLLSTFIDTLSDKPDVTSTITFLPWLSQLPIIGKVYLDWKKAESSWSSLSDYEKFKATRKLQWILSCLKFGKKAVIDRPDLEITALGSWLANEERLKKVRPSNEIITLLNMIAKAVIPRFVDESMLPRHGSGKNSEKKLKTLVDKLMRKATIPQRMADLYYRHDRKRNSRTRSKGWTELHWSRINGGVIIRQQEKYVSEWRTVAKSDTARRNICFEPVDLMYGQQGVRWMFVNTFESTKLRRFIDLKDQSRNAKAAMLASKYQHLTTVDLKDASDNIKSSLFRRIFPYSVWKHVNATRSLRVRLPTGEVVKPCKLAPMGSAVCFPAQTIMFVVIGIAAHLIHYYGGLDQLENFGYSILRTDWFDPTKLDEYISNIPLMDSDVLWSWVEHFMHNDAAKTGLRKYGMFVAYGDDTVVDSHVYPILSHIYSMLGFVENKNKTFTSGSGYRESCGIEAYLGFDVTPFIWKMPNVDGPSEPAFLQSAISLANRAFLHGFDRVRNYVLRVALRTKIDNVDQVVGINPFRFTLDPEQHHLILTNRSKDLNWHLPKVEYDGSSPHSHEFELLIDNAYLANRGRRVLDPLKVEQDLSQEFRKKFMVLLLQSDVYQSITFVPEDNGTSVENDDYRYSLAMYRHGSNTPLSDDSTSTTEYRGYTRHARIKLSWAP